MKVLIGNEFGSYSFNPQAKTIIISSAPNLRLENLLLITNVTKNIILYNFADSTLGATLDKNIITLDYNTASMSNTDALQIFVEVEDPNNDLMDLLRRLVKLNESVGSVDSLNRQRVSVDNAPTLAGSGYGFTNTPLGNPYLVANNNLYPFTETPVDQRWRIIDACRTSYAVGIRSNLE